MRAAIAARVAVCVVVTGGIAVGVSGHTHAADPSTFTIATRFADSTFDPARHHGEFDAMDILNLYDPLVLPVAGDVPKPHVATRWVASADSRIWTFVLRDDVRFHDGALLTAADVVYSMDRMLTMQQGHAYQWAGLLRPGSTVALDDQTVRFTLDAPFGPFVETLVQFFIVNADLLRANTQSDGTFGGHGDYGTVYLERHDAGSGPYGLSHVDPGERRAYAKFADYWQGWGNDKFDRVAVRVVRETAFARTLLTEGDVDYVDRWQPPEFYHSIAAEDGVTVPEAPDAQLFLVQMNTSRPPLDDVYFRKAVSYAFDYVTAIESIFDGAVLARGPIPSALPGYDPSTPAYPYDIGAARAMLAKSKYRPDEFELKYTYLEAGVHEPIGRLLQVNLAQLGIKVKLTPQRRQLVAPIATGTDLAAHFFPTYYSAQAPTPDRYTFGLYHPASHGDWQAASFYSNEAVTELIEQARSTPDGRQRNALYAQASKLIVDDAAALWIANPLHRVALSKRVKNYRHIGLTGFDLRVYDLARD